jgi:hypothetical protein
MQVTKLTWKGRQAFDLYRSGFKSRHVSQAAMSGHNACSKASHYLFVPCCTYGIQPYLNQLHKLVLKLNNSASERNWAFSNLVVRNTFSSQLWNTYGQLCHTFAAINISFGWSATGILYLAMSMWPIRRKVRHQCKSNVPAWMRGRYKARISGNAMMCISKALYPYRAISSWNVSGMCFPTCGVLWMFMYLAGCSVVTGAGSTLQRPQKSIIVEGTHAVGPPKICTPQHHPLFARNSFNLNIEPLALARNSGNIYPHIYTA